MSYWTYINGTITVRPMGRTQPEKRYILETVLNHLPRVTGSEGDMNTYIIQKNGYNSSCSCDEFGEVTNNLVDRIGILEDVGASYILLRSFENDSLIYCDIYSIKFITISTTGIYTNYLQMYNRNGQYQRM